MFLFDVMNELRRRNKEIKNIKTLTLILNYKQNNKNWGRTRDLSERRQRHQNVVKSGFGAHSSWLWLLANFAPNNRCSWLVDFVSLTKEREREILCLWERETERERENNYRVTREFRYADNPSWHRIGTHIHIFLLLMCANMPRINKAYIFFSVLLTLPLFHLFTQNTYASCAHPVIGMEGKFIVRGGNGI